MEKLEEILLEQFKESQFYAKYQDKYISDIILRNVLPSDKKFHWMYSQKKDYSNVHQYNVDVMRDLYHLFAVPARIEDKDILWEMIYAFYLDPDGYAIKERAGITCSADGLFSIRRIYRKHGLSEEAIEDYEKYRKVPIFFFPRERNGINMSRASVFGDRIDHTLFDLKNYFQGNKEDCRLATAYRLPKTSKWLEDLGSFEELVEGYGIKGIFVNDDYEVFDLERGGESVITQYSDQYRWEWSDTYYGNLKNKIGAFMEDAR